MKRQLLCLTVTLLASALLAPMAFADRPVVANPHRDNPKKRITVEERLQAAEKRKEAADPATAEEKAKKQERKAKHKARKQKDAERLNK